MMTPLIRKMDAFVSHLTYNSLPGEMKRLSKYAILDAVGVALAGWSEPAVKLLMKVHSHGTPSGKASLWGENWRATPILAALINGTASHALDYDDVAMSALVHPSAPVLAAAIPIAEVLESSGKEILVAHAVGTETMVRVGLEMGYKHYGIGWHATGTLGTIGAAVACSRLMGLEGSEFVHAVSIAGSMAGGLRRNFGTMTKPLHVGLAASHGVEAALLAQEGFTGADDIFGEEGYLSAFTGGERRKAGTTKFGDPFDLSSNGLSVKKFPCCYQTHKLIQASLNIRERDGISLDQVSDVTCFTPPGLMTPLIHHRPVTGLQAKFSAEFTVAAAIADGKVDLETFEEASVRRQGIQRLLRKVHLKENPGRVTSGSKIETGLVVVVVNTKDGKSHSEGVRDGPGSKQNPLTEEERRKKWNDCIEHFARGRGAAGGDLSSAINVLFSRALRIDDEMMFSDWVNAVTDSLQGEVMEEPSVRGASSRQS